MHTKRARTAAIIAALVALPRMDASAAAGATTLAADARRGEALFTGASRLANGGAPCLACHGVAGHGLARAASFGPDLTGAWASYGAEALDATLADVQFPSMAPLYAKHVLTPGERADLEAFLAGAGRGAPPALGLAFAAGVAAIAALFLAASAVVGRGRGRKGTP